MMLSWLLFTEWPCNRSLTVRCNNQELVAPIKKFYTNLAKVQEELQLPYQIACFFIRIHYITYRTFLWKTRLYWDDSYLNLFDRILSQYANFRCIWNLADSTVYILIVFFLSYNDKRCFLKRGNLLTLSLMTIAYTAIFWQIMKLKKIRREES